MTNAKQNIENRDENKKRKQTKHNTEPHRAIYDNIYTYIYIPCTYISQEIRRVQSTTPRTRERILRQE